VKSVLSFNPPVIAHRGASAYAPENTLAAFAKAAQLGATWVEFDVMQAASGEPVVFHDDTLDRTTNGAGELAHFSFTYLRTLDAGRWFAPQFAGEKIPSFTQVMMFLQEMHLSANVELKATQGQDEALVAQILLEIKPFLDQQNATILFSSFSIPALYALRKSAPQALIGLLLHEWEPNWEVVCRELNCVSVHVNQEIMTAADAKKIKQMGKKLLCYTVNDPTRAQELFRWGVDAVFSDAPDVIIAASMQGCPS
jgi:glycerophosphoryl diester phosphodiesterase